jgi:toxin ParE1/3/4
VTGYLLSIDAEEDLQGIFLFSEESWGEAQASEFIFGLFEVFEIIGDNPRIGRLRPELGDGIRSLPHASHVVFFMDWQGEAAIVRVLNKSRDLETLFGSIDPTKGLSIMPVFTSAPRSR